MRLLAFAVLLAVGLIVAAAPTRSAPADAAPGFEFVSTAELTRQARSDLYGLPVELLFVPTEVREAGELRLLRDAATGLTCAAGERLASRLGDLGDDFLVVRGRLGGGVIENCEVVRFDGLAWEERRLAERRLQRTLFEAGRL